jgi:hypothetical protein
VLKLKQDFNKFPESVGIMNKDKEGYQDKEPWEQRITG